MTARERLEARLAELERRLDAGDLDYAEYLDARDDALLRFSMGRAAELIEELEP